MIENFLGIGIVGAALSGIIQFIKVKWETSGLKVKLLTILLSVLVGWLYVALQGTPIWATILGVLAAASTVYAFFLK